METFEKKNVSLSTELWRMTKGSSSFKGSHLAFFPFDVRSEDWTTWNVAFQKGKVDTSVMKESARKRVINILQDKFPARTKKSHFEWLITKRATKVQEKTFHSFSLLTHWVCLNSNSLRSESIWLVPKWDVQEQVLLVWVWSGKPKQRLKSLLSPYQQFMWFWQLFSDYLSA